MKLGVLSGIVLLISVASGTVFAQGTHPNRTAVVSQAKADLAATGATFDTTCKSFAIVELAAWRMRDEQAGLLSKPGGNNCRGFAVDIIAYPDGEIYDVIIGSETTNTPAWQVPGAGIVDPSRYRAAHDPEFDTPAPPAPPVPPTPPTPPSDPIDISTQLAAIYAQNVDTHKKVDAINTSLEEHRRVSRSLYDRALGFFRDPRTITMILGVLAGRFVIPGGN